LGALGTRPRCWDAIVDKHHLATAELRRIHCRPVAVEAVLTRHGTLVGPIMADLTGHEELTPYKGGWCGNDVFPGVLNEEQQNQARVLTRNLGDRLAGEGPGITDTRVRTLAS